MKRSKKKLYLSIEPLNLFLQCLEEEPEARPASARAILASLPGGDPLEVAVLAGETPSPDLVAAAGAVGDLTSGLAWTGLGVALVSLVLSAFFADRQSLLGTMPRPLLLSPMVLQTIAKLMN